MAGRYIGVSVKRKEDPRLLMGRARYIDDIKLEGMTYAGILRSPYAHAKVKKIDYSQALKKNYVKAVLTTQEVLQKTRPTTEIFGVPSGVRPITFHCLAHDRVFFVGDPVTAVSVDDRYLVEDALDSISVEYEPLPPIVDVESASNPSSPKLYHDWDDNVIFGHEIIHGNVDGALTQSDLRITNSLDSARASATPMEGRGCIAIWDREGTLTVWSSHQRTHMLRSFLAEALRLPDNKVRVVTPEMGGGFGMKLSYYPEDIICSLLAIKTGMPVKWIESRREQLTSSSQGRDQRHDIEIGLKKDGSIVALRDRIILDSGSGRIAPYFGSTPIIVGDNFLLGPYKIPNVHIYARCVVTNKPPIGALRGYGKPPGRLALETTIDDAARMLNLDPAELRRRNLINVKDFPYKTSTGAVYDSGNFEALLDRALEVSEYWSFRAEREKMRSAGLYRGIGLAMGVGESGTKSTSTSKQAGYDSARIRINPSGSVTVFLGGTPHGQSHETTLAQVAAEELGVRLEDVHVVHGDTDLCPFSSGSFADRGGSVSVGAVWDAARKIRGKMLEIAAHLLQVDLESVELKDGFRVKGDKDRSVTVKDVAETAYYTAANLPKGLEPGLEVSSYYEFSSSTSTPSSCHVAKVEVDVEACQVKVLKYLVVQDCGVMINPMVVEGQAHGGVAQGLGNALYEEIVHTKDGQPANTSFMDYLIPSSTETPDIEIFNLETPSLEPSVGSKGVGDGIVAPVTAAIANALLDALSPFHVRIDEIPITGERIWKMIKAARTQAMVKQR